LALSKIFIFNVGIVPTLYLFSILFCAFYSKQFVVFLIITIFYHFQI
jgi:hypothetical protein